MYSVAAMNGLLRLLSIVFYCIYTANAAPADSTSSASFYVPTLPGLRQGPNINHHLNIYAGHISSDPNATHAAATDITAHLFFVLVKARRVADKERIMFWFNGGPGCSSMDGLMMEVGPWRFDERGEMTTVEGGWEEYTHMVFVDQPAGTGFSYTSTNRFVHGPEQAAQQLLEFFKHFYNIFPEYRDTDMYLAGESYAGQYIPYFADAILSSDIVYPLRGVAIGNGWFDGRHQYPSYLQYAVRHGIVDPSSSLYNTLKAETDACMKGFNAIGGYEPTSVALCENLVVRVLGGKATKHNGKDMCVNIYDVRLMDVNPACGMNWPPEIHNVTTYLDRRDVVYSLHATAKSESWVECGGSVGSHFERHPFNSSVTILPSVLAEIPVLIFAGDQDFICNYMGLEDMIKALHWNGDTGLGTVQTQSWTVAGNPAGTWVTSRNLTYVKVFNASHMVPFDVPHVAHDMILRFMNVNFSALIDGSAGIPSTLGGEPKPTFGGTADQGPANGGTGAGKSPEQDKAMWEAYYNAGSAALVLLLVLLAIGTFLWCKMGRRRVQLPFSKISSEEESIPLNSDIGRSDEESGTQRLRKGKGKGKETERGMGVQEEAIFEVGDSDDEERYRTETKGHSAS